MHVTIDHCIISRQSLRVWNMKPTRKCLKPTFFQIASRGLHTWLQQQKTVSLWENYATSQFPHECMVSIRSFKSSFIEYDAHFVNYHPISSKIDKTARYILWCGYLRAFSLILSAQHTSLTYCTVLKVCCLAVIQYQ